MEKDEFGHIRLPPLLPPPSPANQGFGLSQSYHTFSGSPGVESFSFNTLPTPVPNARPINSATLPAPNASVSSENFGYYSQPTYNNFDYNYNGGFPDYYKSYFTDSNALKPLKEEQNIASGVHFSSLEVNKVSISHTDKELADNSPIIDLTRDSDEEPQEKVDLAESNLSNPKKISIGDDLDPQVMNLSQSIRGLTLLFADCPEKNQILNDCLEVIAIVDFLKEFGPDLLKIDISTSFCESISDAPNDPTWLISIYSAMYMIIYPNSRCAPTPHKTEVQGLLSYHFKTPNLDLCMEFFSKEFKEISFESHIKALTLLMNSVCASRVFHTCLESMLQVLDGHRRQRYMNHSKIRLLKKSKKTLEDELEVLKTESEKHEKKEVLVRITEELDTMLASDKGLNETIKVCSNRMRISRILGSDKYGSSYLFFNPSSDSFGIIVEKMREFHCISSFKDLKLFVKSLNDRGVRERDLIIGLREKLMEYDVCLPHPGMTNTKRLWEAFEVTESPRLTSGLENFNLWIKSLMPYKCAVPDNFTTYEEEVLVQVKSLLKELGSLTGTVNTSQKTSKKEKDDVLAISNLEGAISIASAIVSRKFGKATVAKICERIEKCKCWSIFCLLIEDLMHEANSRTLNDWLDETVDGWIEEEEDTAEAEEARNGTGLGKKRIRKKRKLGSLSNSNISLSGSENTADMADSVEN